MILFTRTTWYPHHNFNVVFPIPDNDSGIWHMPKGHTRC